MYGAMRREHSSSSRSTRGSLTKGGRRWLTDCAAVSEPTKSTRAMRARDRCGGFTTWCFARTPCGGLRPSVRRAHEFLLDHLADDITLDALAEHARADKFHLCRAFSREIGFPPYAFLTQARIACARILLRRGLRPSEIAPLLGVCDQSQMHRHFRRIVGCTPGAYARMC